MAVYLRYNSWYIFSFATLCKTTTWNDQILRWMENIEPRRENFKIFISNFIVFYIQFRESFDKEKQVKWLKSVTRLVYKIYIYFLIDVVLGVWVIVKYFWTQF